MANLTQCFDMTTQKSRRNSQEWRKGRLRLRNIDRKTRRNICTPFQYKLWAEMYVGGGHLSLEELPSAAMFRRDNKQSKKSHSDLNTTVVDGMLTVMNNLCQALTPTKQIDKAHSPSPSFSPMKRAQLRSTCLKQLSELRDLHDTGVLHKEEYEEQRSDLVHLMRQLK